MVMMEGMIRAFKESQMWVHMHLIHFVAAFMVSGLPLISRDWFGWIATAFGYPIAELFGGSYSAYSLGIQILRWVHRISAFGLALVLVPYIVLEIFRITSFQKRLKDLIGRITVIELIIDPFI